MLFRQLIAMSFVALTIMNVQPINIAEPSQKNDKTPDIEQAIVKEQADDHEKVTKKEETFSDITNEEMTYGNAGRLVVEDVGINVKLYWCYRYEDERNQYITDMEDSASLYDFRSYGELALGIGDHNNQGFDGLYSVVPGTIAKIYHEDGSVITLRCIETDRNSTNDTYDICDSNGRSLSMIGSNSLYMYTCNPEGWWSVTTTIWEYC